MGTRQTTWVREGAQSSTGDEQRGRDGGNVKHIYPVQGQTPPAIVAKQGRGLAYYCQTF